MHHVCVLDPYYTLTWFTAGGCELLSIALQRCRWGVPAEGEVWHLHNFFTPNFKIVVLGAILKESTGI